MAGENRAFITRAVTWAVNQGVTQFADLGAGLPMPRRGAAAREIHETAQALTSSARVAYVDNDPVVHAHSRVVRALVRRGDDFEPADGAAVVEADLREPGNCSRTRRCSRSSTPRNPCA
jgi:hypothetical protein